MLSVSAITIWELLTAPATAEHGFVSQIFDIYVVDHFRLIFLDVWIDVTTAPGCFLRSGVGEVGSIADSNRGPYPRYHQGIDSTGSL